ncbi:MAG TPA: MFS transporter [Solirubrobacteraceae bacterium]|nr:MFS transporter [Solirubrobacteraceae bacterium]
MRLRRTTGVVIVAGCLIAMIGFGVRTSMGLFTEPLSVFRGWDRETFALAMAIQNLLWGVGQPFAGAVADRYGAGRVLAAGGAVYTAGVLLMALSTSGATLAITGGVLVGLGLSGGSFTIVLAAFARLVPAEQRSWALGLGTAAGSLGQFVFAPIGQGFIGSYGPVTALLLLSVFVALVPLLATALTGRGSEDELAAEPEVSAREAIRGALRHPSYVLLTCGFFVCGFHIAFISTHLPPYLTDLGFSGALAAWALALIGLFNVIGAYSAGVIGGVHSKRLLLSGIYFARAVAFALFLVVPTTPFVVLAFAATIGLLWLSTVPPTSALVAVMFGTRHVGMLFGFVFLSHQVGAFIGAWLGGVVFEATGAYELMWWLSIVLGLAAAIVHLPIHEQRAPRWAASPA